MHREHHDRGTILQFQVKLTQVSAWVLTVCAVLSTIAVVHREFASNPAASAAIALNQEPRYVEGWREALTIGLRAGSADAPLEVVEFADFQCPYCAKFEKTLEEVRAKYPDQVSVTLVHLPIPYHDFAESAARVAECAHAQGRFEEMRPLLFNQQQAFGLVPWTEFARQANISDVEQFDLCVADSRPVARIELGKRLAEKMDVRGTPTVLVNGWKWPRVPTFEDFEQTLRNIADGKSLNTEID